RREERRAARNRASGREDEKGVARRAAAIDGERIERLIDRRIERSPKRGWLDMGVSEQEGEHGRHVRRDHAGAFGDAIDGDLDAIDFGLARGELRVGVGGHDGARGLLEGLRLRLAREIAQEAGEFRRIERLADHARRSDIYVGLKTVGRAGCGFYRALY